VARRRRDAPPRGGASLPVGANQGRGEKREGEREGPGFKLNFLKILHRNMKNFKYESCREFENLQLLIYPNVYLSHGLKVILNSRLVGFELLVISCVKHLKLQMVFAAHFVRY
jgi:hypothetical protein